MDPRGIGPYNLASLLGEGGMGSVYEGIHRETGQRVAIKLLDPVYSANRGVLGRFFNEARAINLIDHPSIVKTFEFGLLPDGVAYLVMELIRGETLWRHLVRAGPALPADEALRIARQITSPLVAAHDKGVVHRDLKPANVMLVPPARPGERPELRLLDFGIAKLTSQTGLSQTDHTRTRERLGTPRYMSPEQCQRTADVDGRSDIYSLGVVLFQMLTGRPPFIGGPAEVMRMHLYDPPPAVRDLAPQVPEALGDLVELLLGKDRARRPTSAALLAILDGLAPQVAAAAAASEDPDGAAPTELELWADPTTSGPTDALSDPQ